ncbi:MutS-related protein [Dictyobacter kobayashii]|uniref:DNA mismatch repair proteins mutS family domain-containing protein n=1 Tax=Dictyobacter kobayashii TaxID=2014872 RepID=A0A402AMD3_9CHLR|nr:hypothetical protein [Dictyobacter kobayashii]GCE20297.1 hypothetical protein KDK_40970 [Dictyobacter kobayashii]
MMAIARAVVEHLHNEIEARTLFATHYHELAALDQELAHLHVYTVAISEDDPNGIVFLHRVIAGCAERSFGVHVAKLAGMPPSIVQRAEKVLQQLETNPSVLTAAHNFTQRTSRVAESNGFYASGHSQSGPLLAFHWQTRAAQSIAEAVERGERAPSLDDIDVQAITPMDALNLLFLLQKKKNVLH